MKIKIIGISIISVVIITLASLSSVVGYQTVESTNQNKIIKEIDQRELLFQTIVDIANNKEIQQIMLKSQINKDGKFQTLNTPIVTKNQIKRMYFIGLLFSRIISKSKIQSTFEYYQLSNQEMQNEITAVIKNDNDLDWKVTQLLNSDCDCNTEQTPSWSFPVLCSVLNVLMIPPLFIFLFGSVLESVALWFRIIGLIGGIMTIISIPVVYAIIYFGEIFDCKWWFIST